MQALTQPSEYAIRALTHLARRGSDDYVLARDLAAELDIPAPFLAKVLRALVDGGVLESQRGRGGGFRLAVAPRDVTLHEIVDLEEGLDRPRRCVLGQAECTDQRACPLHETWKGVWEALHERLQRTTLADVMRFCEERPASGYPLPVPPRRRRRRRN